VSLWDAAKCHLEEDSKTHRQQISQLIWHPDGKHFMTADNQGKVCVVLVHGRRGHGCHGLRLGNDGASCLYRMQQYWGVLTVDQLQSRQPLQRMHSCWP
jgi:hypothetical protein